MEPAVTHRLVAIGYLSGMTVYIDVPREEAIRRYREATGNYYGDGRPISDEDFATLTITEFEFTDEFQAYEVSKE